MGSALLNVEWVCGGDRNKPSSTRGSQVGLGEENSAILTREKDKAATGEKSTVLTRLLILLEELRTHPAKWT